MARVEPRSDADSAPYWAAAQDGRFVLQECDECHRRRFPPREHCPVCLSPSSTWRAATGRGTLASWSTVHRAFVPAFVDIVPYTVALVRLADDDAVMLVGRLHDVDADEVAALSVGRVVEAVVDATDPGVVGWRLVGSS